MTRTDNTEIIQNTFVNATKSTLDNTLSKELNNYAKKFNNYLQDMKNGMEAMKTFYTVNELKINSYLRITALRNIFNSGDFSNKKKKYTRQELRKATGINTKKLYEETKEGGVLYNYIQYQPVSQRGKSKYEFVIQQNLTKKLQQEVELEYQEYKNILDTRQQILQNNIAKSALNAYRDIMKLRELLTYQAMVYDMMRKDHIVKTLSEDEALGLFTIVSDRGSISDKLLNRNGLSNTGLVWSEEQQIGKESTVISSKYQDVTQALQEIGLDKNSIILEILSNLNSGTNIDAAIKQYVDLKKVKFTRLKINQKIGQASMASLPFYMGGDTARISSSGKYEMVQSKASGGMISFSSVYNALTILTEQVFNNKMEANKEKLVQFYTFEAKDVIDSVQENALFKANKEAKEVISKKLGLVINTT